MKKLKRGYSIIEVLAAFAIISIAILPIMSMYPAIFRQNRGASEIEEASRLAMTVVDFIKARGYINMRANTTMVDPKRVGDANSERTNPGGLLYTLRRANENSTAYTTVRNGDYALDRDLGFGAITNINDAFVILNAKGLDLSNVVIMVIMKRADVELVQDDGNTNETHYIDPINNTATNVMYGIHPYTIRKTAPSGPRESEFIVGRIIIGWGNDVEVANTGTRQQRDRSLTGKEKAYGINFIVTPIEEPRN